jgi:hypothetical protein
VLAVHAGKDDIELADQVISDLAYAWPARDEAGVRLSMDQRRADAFIGLLRAVRDHSVTGVPTLNAAAGTPGLPRVPVRRVHDLGLVLHADTLFGDGPAAEETGQLRGLGQPAVVDPDSARTLARKQLREGTGVQVLVVDDSGAVQHVVRLDRDTARSCGSREKLADAPPLEVEGHDPSEAIARHVRAAAPTCSFYDCPRQARSCDLDHDTPWPRGPTSVSNLDPKCRRHHNAKTLGVVQTRLTAGPGAGRRTADRPLDPAHRHPGHHQPRATTRRPAASDTGPRRRLSSPAGVSLPKRRVSGTYPARARTGGTDERTGSGPPADVRWPAPRSFLPRVAQMRPICTRQSSGPCSR